jgi:MFS family permease
MESKQHRGEQNLSGHVRDGSAAASNNLPPALTFELGGPRARFTLWICSLLWMVNFMDRQVMAVVLEPAKRELGFSDAKAGALGTALLIGVAALAIPAAALADRWGRRSAITTMALIWSLATLATGFGCGFAGMLSARMLTGAGEAGYSSAAAGLVAGSYPEAERGRRLGFFNMFQVIGIALGAVLAGALSTHFGWRAPFFVFAGLGFALCGLALVIQDHTLAASPAPRPSAVASARSLLQRPPLRWLYVGNAAFTAMSFSLLTWLPGLIARRYGLLEDAVGLAVGGASLFAIPGALCGGVFADRLHRRRRGGHLVLAAAAALFAALTAAFGLWGSLQPSAAVALGCGLTALPLFCASLAAVTPASMAAAQTFAGEDTRALAWGLGLTLSLVFGGAWAPSLTGLLSDAAGGGAHGLASALLVMSALGVVSAACFYRGAQRAEVGI